MKTPRITASEAVFGFAAWLTTRKGTLKPGSAHNASPIVDRVVAWLKVNKLRGPRKTRYPKNIKHPRED